MAEKKLEDGAQQKLEDGAHKDPDPDVDMRGIVGAGVVLAVGLAAVMGGAALFTDLLKQKKPGTETSEGPSPMATELSHVPPEPRLQPAPRGQLHALRAYEKQRLGSYGWVDKDAGVTHLPIERAMKLTAERGLPVRDGGARDDAQDLAMPTESSLGTHKGGER